MASLCHTPGISVICCALCVVCVQHNYQEKLRYLFYVWFKCSYCSWIVLVAPPTLYYEMTLRDLDILSAIRCLKSLLKKVDGPNNKVRGCTASCWLLLTPLESIKQNSVIMDTNITELC